MALELSALKKWFSLHEKEIFSDFFTFLRFASIGTDPDYKDETRKCAKWLQQHLENIGFDAALYETSVHPIVYASYLHAGKDKPTLLLYHHYDVQPVDPLELWKTKPFEPAIRNGNVYARGAVDNKGQCFYSMTALKAFLQICKNAKVNLKVLIEGEEESGSEGTLEFLKKHKDLLKADYLLVIDSGLPAAGVPAITMGLRGIIAMEVSITNTPQDLHSGIHGGIVLNPNRALVQILAQMWDNKGKVAIPHFYDDVQTLSEEELAKLDMSFDQKSYKERFDAKALAPEPGFTPSETNFIRPVLELNGISGGYAGKGFKTVIPSIATAKISCRIVPDQDPQKLIQSITKFIEEKLPKGLELKITTYQGTKAFRGSFDSPIVKMVGKAYEEVLGKECRYLLSGASIPIVGDLAEASGAHVVVMGFGLDEDGIHAPNEHFGTDRFEQGFMTVTRILSHFQNV